MGDGKSCEPDRSRAERPPCASARLHRPLRRHECVVKLETRIHDIVQALPRIFLETPLQQPPDTVRDIAWKRVPVRLLREYRGEHIGHGRARENAPSRQQLEQNASESPDVGAAVDCKPFGLLRRHVGGGSENDAGLGDLGRHHGERVDARW
jgi:hypothetical protein